MEILISCICSIAVSSAFSILVTKRIMKRNLKKYQAMFYLGESENSVKLGTLEEFLKQKKSQNSALTK